MNFQNNQPLHINSAVRHGIVKASLGLLPLTAMMFDPKLGTIGDIQRAFASSSPPIQPLQLGAGSYSDIGDMKICKIINGMWQVSGAHGYTPNIKESTADMARHAEQGFTSFDLADIYGPAEEYVGEFTRTSAYAKDCNFFTKWVPRPQDINREITSNAINRSLKRMRTDRLDLLQFHWWDYSDKNYYNAIHELMNLQEQEKIRYLGLTNFDTSHMLDLIEQGAPIVTNQVIAETVTALHSASN